MHKTANRFNSSVNTVYLNDQSFKIFQSKLNIIKTRKNKFVANDFKATIPSSCKPSSPNKPTMTKDYYVLTNNFFLANRLDEIISRKNKYGLNDNQYYIEKKHRVNDLVRSLKQKNLHEQNDIFRSRLMKKAGFISTKQLEDDFNKTKHFPSNFGRFNTEATIRSKKHRQKKGNESPFPTITTKNNTINTGEA